MPKVTSNKLPPGTITATRAAIMLGWNYQAVLRSVMRRKLRGDQDPRTRAWYVDAADVARVAREQRNQPTAA